MASVNVYTTAKVDALTDVAVVDATVNGSNHLILTTQGGDSIDAGAVNSGSGGGSTPGSATTSAQGIVELATDVETTAGTDTTRAVTPFGLAAVTAVQNTAIGGKQPSNTNLSAISALTPTNNDFLQRKGGVWTNRTPAQAAVDLGISTVSTAPFYNVKADGTVKGDGTTDDTAALNTVIANSPVGSTVFFPPGTYLISNKIVLPSLRYYLAAGAAKGNGVLIKQKNTANMVSGGSGAYTGMFVSQDWANNATVSGYALTIDGFAFEGNTDNNPTSTACGIILMNFWSTIKNCYIADIPQHGILLTDVGINGTTLLTNSASENVIMNCKISGVGGDGIHQDVNVEGTNLDGLIEDCYISGIDNGCGIFFNRSAGWAIRRNHLYGIGNHGIELGHSFATHVSDNYIEDFGGLNVLNSWYWGIGFTQMDWWATQIVDNHVACNEPSTRVSTYYGIRANAGSGEANGRCTITGNQVFGNNGTNGYGVVMENESGGAYIAVVRNNLVTNMAHDFDNDTPTALLVHDGTLSHQGVPTLAIGAQGSAISVIGGYGNPTNTAGSISMISKSSSLAAGVLGTVTFSKPFGWIPKAVIISPINGLASTASIYATWTASAITFSANGPLSASTTYQFAYQVIQ